MSEPTCSRPEQIAALEVGETFSISKRYVAGTNAREELAGGLDAMRATMQAAAARAKAKTNATYSIEGGLFWTRGLDVIATVAVTRMQ